MADPVLKPCPFCGCKIEVVRKEEIGVLRCPDTSPCLGSGLGNFFKLDMEDSAFEAWNRRAIIEQEAIDSPVK